jgi:hypothetical protein
MAYVYYPYKDLKDFHIFHIPKLYLLTLDKIFGVQEI